MIGTLETDSPEFQYLLRDTINKVHLIVAKLTADNALRNVAVEFNSGVSDPLTKLRKHFNMPSGNVVKVQRNK